MGEISQIDENNENSILIITEAEELLRLQYRASLDRIMKMSIYDNKSANDIQFMVNEFMFNSGNVVLEVTPDRNSD